MTQTYFILVNQVNRLNKCVNLELKKSYLLVKCQQNFTECEKNWVSNFQTPKEKISPIKIKLNC